MLPEFVTLTRRNVKWARIQVQPDGGVHIVVPCSLDAAEIFSLYQNKQPWIENKRARALARQSEVIPIASDELMLFGRTFRFIADAAHKRHACIDHEEGTIFYAKNLLDEGERQRWYREFAKHYLSLRIEQLAGQYDFTFNRLFIREQKTRWGSCSSRGNISLNWKLIKAPLSVSDYVILHELVHTEIMNHSPAFWQRVETMVPDFRESKAWLRTHGYQL